MRALLDVNILIALLDANHLHHVRATAWLAEHRAPGWASCPITQNGCIRIMSQSAYPNPRPAGVVAGRLAEAAASAEHAFWADDLNVKLAKRNRVPLPHRGRVRREGNGHGAAKFHIPGRRNRHDR